MFLEAQELLKSSPWISNIAGVDKLSESKQEESSAESNMYADDMIKCNDVDNITDIHFTSDDLDANINHYSQAMADDIQSSPHSKSPNLARDISCSQHTTSDVSNNRQAQQHRSVIQTPDRR